MPATKTRGPAWKHADDKLLSQLWGAYGIVMIARQLGRTPCSIAKRAARNKLGPSLRGSMSLGQFVTQSGYARSRIKNAASRLGLQLRRSKRMSEKIPRGGRKGKKGRRILVGDEQQDAILAYLAKIPDGEHVWSGRTGHTRAMDWGTGGKPAACLKCAKTDRAHKAKGICKRCYRSGSEQAKKRERDRVIQSVPHVGARVDRRGSRKPKAGDARATPDARVGVQRRVRSGPESAR